MLVVGSAALLAGCGHPVVGKCGAHSDTEGTAHITSIASAPAGESNCQNDPVKVLFDFIPHDPGNVGLAASGIPLTVGQGSNPPRAWVMSSGLSVGSDHPAIRSDQPVGPCSPVVYRFLDLDMAAGLSACY